MGIGAHLPIESARPNECGVQDVAAVGGRDDHNTAARIKAVHLGEHLVERLVALVIADRTTADAPHRVNLIDEDNRRCILAGRREQVAHARRADADEHLDKL